MLCLRAKRQSRLQSLDAARRRCRSLPSASSRDAQCYLGTIRCITFCQLTVRWVFKLRQLPEVDEVLIEVKLLH